MRRNLTVAICSVVLVIVLIFLWRQSQTDTVAIPREEITGVNTGLGQVLGAETVKAVPARGTVVVVTTATPAQLKQRSNYLWSAFESELQKHSLSITAIESLKPGQDDLAEQGALNGLLARHANSDALVFFTDLPDWFTVAESFPQSGVPKIIALDNRQLRMKSRYSGYFTRGVLVALVGARFEPSPAAVVQPQTPREWFDQRYQVYTAANFESLPE